MVSDKPRTDSDSIESLTYQRCLALKFLSSSCYRKDRETEGERERKGRAGSDRVIAERNQDTEEVEGEAEEKVFV